jgi:hypothetical protein
MRFLADIPDDDVQWLDRRAAEEGKSRAALLREAVVAFRAESGEGIERYFGMWKDRRDLGDAVDEQRQLRTDSARAARRDPDLFGSRGSE